MVAATFWKVVVKAGGWVVISIRGWVVKVTILEVKGSLTALPVENPIPVALVGS